MPELVYVTDSSDSDPNEFAAYADEVTHSSPDPQPKQHTLHNPHYIHPQHPYRHLNQQPDLPPHSPDPPSSPEHNLPHWSNTNAKRARYRSTCLACGRRIPVGSSITYQFQHRRFVHAQCADAPVFMPHKPIQHPNPPQEFVPTDDPLAPGSPLNKLSNDYRQEAVRWVQFHSNLELIPGIHTSFDTRGVEKYLRHRSATNKNIAGIESKIKKMGEVCNWVLCNTKYQQPSIQYQQLRSAKMDTRKMRRQDGIIDEPNQALATGNFAVTLLLSAFDIRSAQRLLRLDPTHREFLTIHVMQHGGCMRFGIFKDLILTRGDLLFAAQDNCHALKTTWRKTRKSNRAYHIRFPCKPDKGSPAQYKLPGARGPTYVSVGKIITWYLQVTGLMNAPNDAPLFPELSKMADRRGSYAAWLRFVYGEALPRGSPLPARIRPHSGRAGWATDRSRQCIPRHTVMAEGRWSDPRAMCLYIRTNVRDLSTSARHRMISEIVKNNWTMNTQRNRR